MQKPTGYDETQSGSGFIPVELGGHTAVIKRVLETESKTGKPMLQIAIDFDAADSQPNYFKQMFEEDNRENKKWPFQGTQYILVEDGAGRCSRSFKSFITSAEDSNGTECKWGSEFENWFRNKKIGVVYGEVEEEYNGEIKTRHRIRYFCSYDRAKAAAIPAKKLFKPQGITPATNDFMTVPDVISEEIPF